MLSFATGVYVGLVIGMFAGFALCALLTASKRADECDECQALQQQERQAMQQHLARHMVSMDAVCMEMGAEGFDGRERRLAVEVDRDLGIEPASYREYAQVRAAQRGVGA